MFRKLTSRMTAACLTVIAIAVQADASKDPMLCFTENKGQWDEHVLFKADGTGGLTWFIERDGFTVLFSSSPTSIEGGGGLESFPFANNPLNHFGGYRNGDERFDPSESNPPYPPFNRSGGGVRSHALKFKFRNALPRTAGNFLPERTSPAVASSVESSERLSWNNNYFLGNDESKWAPDCGNFQRVVLKDVWEGVDVVWRGTTTSSTTSPSIAETNPPYPPFNRRGGGDSNSSSFNFPLSIGGGVGGVGSIEFDFLIHPSADASQIRVGCLGLTGDLAFNTESTEATESTELSLETSLGTLRMALPEAYQFESDGSLQEVEAKVQVKGENSFGIALPEGYDSSKLLIVDPLVYSTYLGGGGWDFANAIASDGGGGVVVTGFTDSDDFPTTEGAFDRSCNNDDAFIARLTGELNELSYCTYFGGSGFDQARALTLDEEGGVGVAGYTYSDDFPTTEGAFDRSYSNGDVFVARLTGDGRELQYSTYLGGGNEDWAWAIAPDGAGGVIVAGTTFSDDFPTTEAAFDRSFNGGGDDAFVARLSEDGGELLFSTYLGGGSVDDLLAMLPNGEGGVVVAGSTESNNFPTTEGALDRSFNGRSVDAFVANLSVDGSELFYSTYLGGGGEDFAEALAPDGTGGVFVVGVTTSNDFPITDGGFDRSYNGGATDAFVARLSRDGSELLYSTYFGGAGDDQAYALAPDGMGGVFVAGVTNGNDVPTTEEAFDRSYNDSFDVFVAWFSRDVSELFYSTYLGGRGDDYDPALASDGLGRVIVAGSTSSNNYPTTEGVFDESFNSTYDVFVTRLDSLRFLRWAVLWDTIRAHEGDLVEFTISGESSEVNAELTISYSSDNLPDTARFTDHGDGSGTFTWPTTYYDAGEYTAMATLSDNVNQVSAVITILIRNINGPPSRVQLIQPSDRSVIPDDSLVTFIWSSATDPDNDTLTYLLKMIGNHYTSYYDTDSDTARMVTRRSLIWLSARDSLRWEVWAKGGVDSTRCETPFTLLPPLEAGNSPPTPYTLHLTPFPNPFNSSTTIRFGLSKLSPTRIGIYGIDGRLVDELVNGGLEAGEHEVVWDAVNLPSGLYIARLESGSQTVMQKLTLIR